MAPHFGHPLPEQRALAEGRAWTPRLDLGLVTVTGPDRLAWLHSLTTQHLTDLRPGESTETLVLSPQGHIEHAMAVVDDGTATHLIVDHTDEVAGWLESMRFRRDVQVHDRRGDCAAIAWTSVPETDTPTPHGVDLVGDLATPTWTDPWPSVHSGSIAYCALAEHPGSTIRRHLTVCARSDIAAADEAARAGRPSPLAETDVLEGRSPAGTRAWEALRIEAYRPSWGREVDHHTLPAELDWLRTAVHLDKGCYRGQETVARILNVGKPPRRLVFLHLDGSGHLLPERGAPVVVSATGDQAGALTSVALHHELGPIALAVIKRSVPADAALTVADERAGDVPALQEVIVPVDGLAPGWARVDRRDLTGLRANRRRR